MYGLARRAPPDRARAPLAPRLRRLEAGADRQRGLTASSSSTSSARCWTPCYLARRAGFSPTGERHGMWRGHCSNIWNGLGRARRRHLGGARRRGGISPTRRSWPGWRSTARVKTVERVRLDGPARPLARALRDEIHDEVCREGFDPELNSFVQSYGVEAARRQPADDPAGRLPAADDPRVRGTVAAIESSLLPMASCTATRRHRTSTACRQAKGRSCPARSGWPTTTRCWDARRCATAFRAAAGDAQRCRPAGRGIRPGSAACWAISRRRFPISLLVNTCAQI